MVHPRTVQLKPVTPEAEAAYAAWRLPRRSGPTLRAAFLDGFFYPVFREGADAAWQQRVEQRPRRYGSALRGAFIDGYNAAAKTPVGAAIPPAATPTGDPWEAR
jgi:hypothetical protein